jgi:hypothetical protein
MFTGALIVFSLLILFIAIGLWPWWFTVAMFVGGILWILFGPRKY